MKKIYKGIIIAKPKSWEYDKKRLQEIYDTHGLKEGAMLFDMPKSSFYHHLVRAEIRISGKGKNKWTNDKY